MTAGQPRQPSSDLEAYQTMAETVGGPSLRIEDNVIQAAIIIGSITICGLVGWLWKGLMGLIIGGAGAMILSTLLSGFVLMILGFIRAANKRR